MHNQHSDRANVQNLTTGTCFEKTFTSDEIGSNHISR